MFWHVQTVEELHDHKLCQHKRTGQSHAVYFYSVLIICKQNDDKEEIKVLNEYIEKK